MQILQNNVQTINILPYEVNSSVKALLNQFDLNKNEALLQKILDKQISFIPSRDANFDKFIKELINNKVDLLRFKLIMLFQVEKRLGRIERNNNEMADVDGDEFEAVDEERNLFKEERQLVDLFANIKKFKIKKQLSVSKKYLN